MALSIVNNPTAIGAQGSVNSANNNLTKTIKSLSTGLRINSAADDASGLAVSEKLRAQISGLNKAATNAQDAISMLQTAEGAMGSMTSMVQRIRELAVQAGDPAYTSNDRAMLQLEVDQLKEEISSTLKNFLMVMRQPYGQHLMIILKLLLKVQQQKVTIKLLMM